MSLLFGSALNSFSNFEVGGDLLLGNTVFFQFDTDQQKIVGSGNDLVFYTNGTERLRLKNTTGNVGIGTSTVDEKLHIYNSTAPSIKIENSSSVVDGFKINGASGEKNIYLNNTEDADIIFYTNNTERARIENDGLVNIKYTAAGAIPEETDSLQLSYSTAFSDTRNCLAWYNSNNSFTMGRIGMNVGSGYNNCKMSFFTSANQATPTEKMTIDQAGNVGIGDSTPSYQLELSTDSAGKPTSSTWQIASDQRLKEDIEVANYDICYNDIKALDLKYYKWKDDYIVKHDVKDYKRIGWIADDVEKIYPKAVNIVDTEIDLGTTYHIENDEEIHLGYDYPYLDLGITKEMKTLNSDLILSGMFGAIKKLIEKVEILESNNS